MMSILRQKKLIHETPWNNLIILDSCRYDSFKEKHEEFLGFDGELKQVESEASCTKEWLPHTWSENYQGVTYISSNIFMRSRRGEHRFQYEPIHKFRRIIDAWMEGLNPDIVDKHALVTEGRKVLHYIPPHKPCYGRIKEYTYEGYMANLEYILEHVTRLIPKLDGATVITADHGELWRPDRKITGHPCNKEYAELLRIPWFEVKR